MNCKKVAASHGYIKMNDTAEIHLKQLSNMVDSGKHFRSIIKVNGYLRYLKDRAKYEKLYYAETDVKWQYDGFKKFMQSLIVKYSV